MSLINYFFWANSDRYSFAKFAKCEKCPCMPCTCGHKLHCVVLILMDQFQTKGSGGNIRKQNSHNLYYALIYVSARGIDRDRGLGSLPLVFYLFLSN